MVPLVTFHAKLTSHKILLLSFMILASSKSYVSVTKLLSFIF